MVSSNLGALSVYQRPSILFNNILWNQQSDRAIPHIQFSVSNGGNPGGDVDVDIIQPHIPG